MPGRWSVLGLLFAVRATMGLQFQSVATVAPLLTRDLGVGLADIGLLIGLYLAPGIGLALPGGAIGRRLGDKPVLLAGLVMMVAGGLLMALVPSWYAQIAGRLLAGMGGVLLNVLMSKMVSDWFAGHELSTAMAVFVNSWPFGIAVALLLLPHIGSAYGFSAAYLTAAGIVAIGLLLTTLYAPPPGAASAAAAASTWPGRRASAAVATAGVIWALYNVGFAMVFAFGPSMLVERGWTVTSAGSAVSIVLWLVILSVPLGGLLADRLKRYDAIMIAGLLAFAAALVTATRVDDVIGAFIVLGLVCGLPAGSIMSLPVHVLTPATRAVGMGLFFTLFYVGMFAAPVLAGWLAAWTGTAATAFDFGAALLVVCVALTRLFQRLATVLPMPAVEAV